MLSPRILALWTFLLLVGISSSVQAAGIDGTMRAEDKRLEKPVTVTERRIYLSELLARLSRQTGIPISVDDEDTASGTEVEAFFTKLPVGNVLNSLRSLLSIRNAAWSWLRSGEPGAFHYRLVEPVAAKEKALRYHALAQKILENYADTMIRLAEMSPEEREHHKHEISLALALDDDTYADTMVKEKLTWNPIRLFAEAFPKEVQIQVLQGQAEARIPVKDLPFQTQTLFHSVWADYHILKKNAEGTWVAAPEPELLRFYASDAIGNGKEVVPCIFIDLGKSGALSCVGGLDLQQAVRAAIQKMWLLPGERADSPIAQQKVAEIMPDPPPPVSHAPLVLRNKFPTAHPELPGALAIRFAQLSQGTSVPLLALFPDEQFQDPGTPNNHPVQAFLSKMRENTLYPIHKWRGNTLLVIYPAWFLEEDNTLPYRLIKYLPGQDGLFSLSSLVKLLNNINEVQAKRLAPRYPALQAALTMLPAFLLYGKYPEILSPYGTPLDQQKSALLLSIPSHFHRDVLENGTASAVRLVQEEVRDGDSKMIVIRVEARISDEKWVLLGGFSQSVPPAKSQ